MLLSPRSHRTAFRIRAAFSGAGRTWLCALPCLAAVCLAAGGSGCSALHPLEGIPAKRMPFELRGPSRSGKETIDLSRLRQTPPVEYLIDAGDVLAVYVEGVLGKREEVPPVFIPLNGEAQPTLGFPIPVRDDGTISLPLIQPILVRGMTVRRVEETIRKAYVEDHHILQPGHERILISLQKPRTYQILVLRQEASTVDDAAIGSLTLGNAKRGTGQVVTLPAYRNDVLNALAQTGGLPGLDAENAIYVLSRGRTRCFPATAKMTMPTRERRGQIEQVAGVSEGPRTFGHTPVAQVQAPATVYWGHSRALPAAPTNLQQDSAGPSLNPWPMPGSPAGPSDVGARPLPLPAPLPSDPWRSLGTNSEMLPPPMPQPPHTLPDAPGQPWPHVPPAASPFPLPPELQAYAGGETRVVRIPVRLGPGETADFTDDEIILGEGDIVFIESRETEIFYTGGLLGGGQFVLPRDYDLDVLAAISIAQGRQGTGGTGAGFASRLGGIASTNQDISVSASDVVVLRQLPNGTQASIKIDLNDALRDPQERILIQPGDYIILQYKPVEAVAAFVERNILAGSLIGLAASGQQGGGGN